MPRRSPDLSRIPHVYRTEPAHTKVPWAAELALLLVYPGSISPRWITVVTAPVRDVASSLAITRDGVRCDEHGVLLIDETRPESN